MKALRAISYILVSLAALLGLFWAFKGIEKAAYEAYTPRYIEVPVFIEKWHIEKAPEGASSSPASL